MNVDYSTVTKTPGLAVTREIVWCGLVPPTMQGKALLKRLFPGPLVPYPTELQEEQTPPWRQYSIPSTDHAAGFKVTYAVGRRR